MTTAERVQGRLARLMAARLVLSLGLFAAAVALEGAGGAASPPAARQGLYATLAFAFLTTVVFAASLRRIRHPATFSALQIPTDALIVSGLVYFSGGDESLFGFLYLLVVVFGAMVAGRAGGLGAASVCGFLHGALLLATGLGWLPDYGSSPHEPASMQLALWSVQSGALVVVALLASNLSRELASADAQLDASRSDLRQLRTLHRRIVESLLSGLLTTDREGHITSFNPEAERITGVRARHARGRDVDAVIPGARDAVVGPALAGEAPTKLRLRLRFENPDGAVLHLGLAGSVLRGAEGEATGAVVIFQDVTRVVEMEGELRRTERLAAAGRLAADIAHEVRNPLAAISGSIQMLLGGPAAPEGGEGARLMEIVLRETDRLNALITDFLQYAQPRPAKPQRVRLAEVVDGVVEMARHAAGGPWRIDADVSADLEVTADPDQLRQMLWNLCRNALQAMPDGGRLQIDGRPCDGASQGDGNGSRNAPQVEGSGGVEISVADTGVGIPPEVCDRIFDPFFTTKDDGTGLGLATVHRIVEGHGGTLRVESVPGVGTTFRIHLSDLPEES
jgi:two-component system sensor histidine kinase PilS (NtrC family)